MQVVIHGTVGSGPQRRGSASAVGAGAGAGGGAGAGAGGRRDSRTNARQKMKNLVRDGGLDDGKFSFYFVPSKFTGPFLYLLLL